MKRHYSLAARTLEVDWSGIRIMLALTEDNPDIINLGIGQPDFDTPTFIRDAAKQALDGGYTRYPPAKGFVDLRRAISRKLKSENNIIADPDDKIHVTVGAMQVIFNTCLHLLNPGDEVIVVDPGYDYYSQIRLFGGIKPESTFYAFPNISSTGLSSWDLAKYLAKEHKVAVVPGSISFAASMKQLEEGIERIGRGMAALG